MSSEAPEHVAKRGSLERAMEAVFGEAITPFLAFLDELPIGVFVLTGKGKPFYSNRASRELLGVGIEAAAGASSLSVAYHAYRAGTSIPYPEEELPLRRALAGERSSIDDMEIARPDGRIQLEVWGGPVQDDAGRVIYALAAFADISVRRRAEAEVARALEREREAAERLQQLDRLRNDFVAMVAHDLRSPAGVIAGFADFLLARWETLQEAQKLEMLQRIVGSTKTLTRLADDVFEVARIEAGELQCEIETFDLVDLVQRTIADRRDSHPDREYRVDVAGTVPPVLGDPQRQWQVLTNVVSNAVKFSPADTPIDVKVGVAGRFAEVRVRDHGPGIPPGELTKLFKKFSRLHHDKAVEGTGLGLFICRSLVEAQGGTIEAWNAPGGGAAFRYTIPLA